MAFSAHRSTDLGELRPWSTILITLTYKDRFIVLKVVVPGIWDCDYYYGGRRNLSSSVLRDFKGLHTKIDFVEVKRFEGI